MRVISYGRGRRYGVVAGIARVVALVGLGVVGTWGADWGGEGWGAAGVWVLRRGEGVYRCWGPTGVGVCCCGVGGLRAWRSAGVGVCWVQGCLRAWGASRVGVGRVECSWRSWGPACVGLCGIEDGLGSWGTARVWVCWIEASVAASGDIIVVGIIRVCAAGATTRAEGRTSALFSVQWFHFHVLVVSLVFNMLVHSVSPGGHCGERILVDVRIRGFRSVEGCGLRLRGAAVDGRGRRGLVGWIRRWRRWLVEGRVVVVFWLLVSATPGGAATATAAFTALVATAETVDYACENRDHDDGSDDDTNDDGPFTPGLGHTRIPAVDGFELIGDAASEDRLSHGAHIGEMHDLRGAMRNRSLD